MNAVRADHGRAARPWLALVARRRGIVEVVAARALEEIAARRGGIAQLRRGARQDRARKQRISLLHPRVIGDIGVGHESTDAQPSCSGLLNVVQGQTGDVDELRWALDIILHQVEEVGAAGNELGGRIGRDFAHGLGDASGADIGEVHHPGALPGPVCITCSIAATMFT